MDFQVENPPLSVCYLSVVSGADLLHILLRGRNADSVGFENYLSYELTV